MNNHYEPIASEQLQERCVTIRIVHANMAKFVDAITLAATLAEELTS
jgi:hypothetical protein